MFGAGVRQHGLEGESSELADAAERCGAKIMLLLMPTEAQDIYTYTHICKYIHVDLYVEYLYIYLSVA